MQTDAMQTEVAETVPVTVPVERNLYAALQDHFEQSARSLEEFVDEALRMLLQEDQDDLATLKERRAEPTIPYEEVSAELRARAESA
jgi:dsDNA-binding SOS-regulon protein